MPTRDLMADLRISLVEAACYLAPLVLCTLSVNPVVNPVGRGVRSPLDNLDKGGPDKRAGPNSSGDPNERDGR